MAISKWLALVSTIALTGCCASGNGCYAPTCQELQLLGMVWVRHHPKTRTAKRRRESRTAAVK